MRWHPDTCRCQFEVTDWDTDQATTLAACPQHAGLPDQAHFRVVYRGENQVKNFALGDVETHAPGKALGHTFGIAPVGEARPVFIDTQNLTPQERAAIAKAHTRFGTGKVTLR